MNKTRIVIADDHEVVRKGLRAILEAHLGWEVCGEAADGRSAVEKAEELRPNVVIIDIGMPQLNGLEATRQILKGQPDTKVLVLSVYESEQLVEEVLDAGARGYVLKSDASRDLVRAIEELLRNHTFFTSRVGQLVLETYLGRRAHGKMKGGSSPLTPREREVVQLLAEGKSSKEVAVALNLSVKTAETHRANIMRKLDVHSISELVLYAVKNNIVQVEPPLPATGTGPGPESS
jgi:DNA-binding NarL/FixJ family response regulator